MTRGEKILYHQIHPAKVAADWVSTPFALYLLWQRKPVAALALAFGPAIVASLLLIRFADLEPYKESPTGARMKRYMTPAIAGVRAAGAAIMFFGAWQRRPGLLPVGLLVVTIGWLRFLFSPQG